LFLWLKDIIIKRKSKKFALHKTKEQEKTK